MNHADRPRVIVLTDFFKDPDDKQSMIRFLSYASEFDVEGLIATSLAYGTGEVHPEWIEELIDAYGEVRPNLVQHDSRYPTVNALKQVVKAGAPVIRMWVGPGKGFQTPAGFADDSRACEPATNYLGRGKDTPASEHIVRVLCTDDPRPVWILVWGGSMDIAQALWKLREDLGPKSPELRIILGKIRYYQISWQDTGAVWLWNEFPELFRIQCDTAMRGMYTEGEPAFRNQAWVDAHVKTGHRALGACYPVAGNIDGIKEGDTPSFLHLLARGLSDPNKPWYGGWGGRFVPHSRRLNCYIDTPDEHPDGPDDARGIAWSVGRWNEPRNLEFASRMDWCVAGFAHANHAPVACLNGDVGRGILYQEVQSGDVVELDATGSGDPDGDDLSYRWWWYREAGSYQGIVRIEDPVHPHTCLIVPGPTDRPVETIHIILEVTDDGLPPLTSYRRLVLTVHGKR